MLHIVPVFSSHLFPRPIPACAFRPCVCIPSQLRCQWVVGTFFRKASHALLRPLCVRLIASFAVNVRLCQMRWGPIPLSGDAPVNFIDSFKTMGAWNGSAVYNQQMLLISNTVVFLYQPGDFPPLVVYIANCCGICCWLLLL